MIWLLLPIATIAFVLASFLLRCRAAERGAPSEPSGYDALGNACLMCALEGLSAEGEAPER